MQSFLILKDKTGRDHDRRVIIPPPTTADEHITVQRESKARTTLLQSIPDDHVADFHYIDDARDIWNAVKARMQKILSQLNQLKAKPEDEDINLKFLRALPSSWSQVALTLKTKGGLKHLSFDDLYYKLKTLEIHVKGYTTFSSSQSASPSHSAFVSTTKQLAYEDFEQIEKLDLEEMDLKWNLIGSTRRRSDATSVNKEATLPENAGQKGGTDKKRYSSFKIKEIGKKEEDSKALITVDTLVDWIDHDGESDGVTASKEFGMIAGCDIADAIEEGAAKIYNLITGADIEEASTAGDAGEFSLMGVTSEVHNCLFGCDSKSGTHLIKDCDIYEKQMVNKTICIGVGPVHSRNKVNHQNQFVPHAVLLRAGKVNIPPTRPQPVPIVKPKVFAPVPTGRQNRHFPVPTDRGYSPSENPFPDAKDERVFDSGCSRSMTGNKERLDEFQVIQGGKVTFGGGEGRIIGKGTIQTPTLDFENVYYVKELQQFNLFSISQICYRKNRVLFTDTECLVLSKDFKLPDESIVTDEGYIVGYSASHKVYKVYNVPNKRVEETMNLRYLEEKPNVQGLGHEWYFDLDYLTDTLGYKHDKANQSAGTQEAITNPIGTQDADSDSDCDEQVIIVPSYPSHNIQGTEPKDTSGTSDAERLGLGFTNDAEELQKRESAKTIPHGSIPVPTGGIPVPFGDTMVSTDDVLVYTSSPTDSFFDDEPTTRFPSPSDHGNHDLLPGIFSSSSYDDEFGAALNNVASTMEVSPMATKRINTIYWGSYYSCANEKQGQKDYY
nr:ribonuclease H-like domain-containing protein [Tanacetum cinerariifolium]